MSFSNIQCCHLCGGALPRENVVIHEHANGDCETWTDCEFCDVGREALFSEDSAGRRYLVTTQDYRARTEPISYGKFKQRMEDAIKAKGYTLRVVHPLRPSRVA